MTEEGSLSKANKSRSPNYPLFDLKEAVAKAKAVYEQERLHDASLDVIVSHWGYSGLNGRSRRALAAMNAYGLLEYTGSGEGRTAKLTADAQIIVLEADGYQKAIRRAALAPRINSELYERYKDDGLPSDKNLRDQLIIKDGFKDDIVDKFIQEFKSTAAFAKLFSGGTMGSAVEAEGSDSDDSPVTIGSYVQWVNQGVAQFPAPRKVQGLSPNGDYAFVEGTNTGIPLGELSLQEPPTPAGSTAGNPPQNPFAKPSATGDNPPSPAKGTKQAILPTDSGLVKVEWPDRLTPDDFEDIKAWLEILERKIGRSAEPDKKPTRTKQMDWNDDSITGDDD